MPRPCFLIVDREYAGSISTRKLVIETAKLNVITAYSAQEAIETLALFPAMDGIVLDAAVQDMPCAALVSALKQLRPGIPLVVIGTPSHGYCEGADYFLDSFEPAKLLELLTSLVPRAAAVREREREQEWARVTQKHEG